MDEFGWWLLPGRPLAEAARDHPRDGRGAQKADARDIGEAYVPAFRQDASRSYQVGIMPYGASGPHRETSGYPTTREHCSFRRKIFFEPGSPQNSRHSPVRKRIKGKDIAWSAEGRYTVAHVVHEHGAKSALTCDAQHSMYPNGKPCRMCRILRDLMSDSKTY